MAYFSTKRTIPERKAHRVPNLELPRLAFFGDPVILNMCGPVGIKPLTMCLIVSLLTDCSQRALSGIRHGETPFLILTVADDAVSGSISRRSARHEQNSSVLPGDHSHRRRQPLRRCMARRGRLYSDKPRVGYPGARYHRRFKPSEPMG